MFYKKVCVATKYVWVKRTFFRFHYLDLNKQLHELKIQAIFKQECPKWWLNIWLKFSISLAYALIVSKINAIKRTRNVGQRQIHFSDSSTLRCDTAWTYANILLVGVGRATMSQVRTKVNVFIISVYKTWPYKAHELVLHLSTTRIENISIYLRLFAAISKRPAEVLSSFLL